MASLVSFACSTERSLRLAAVAVVVVAAAAVVDVVGREEEAELLPLSVLFLTTLPSYIQSRRKKFLQRNSAVQSSASCTANNTHRFSQTSKTLLRSHFRLSVCLSLCPSVRLSRA